MRSALVFLVAWVSICLVVAATATAQADSWREQRDKAIALYNAGEYRAALPLFDAALSKRHRDIESLIRRGSIYMRLNQPEKAIDDFNTAIRYNPAYHSGYVNRGIARVMLGLNDAAMQDFQTGIALDRFTFGAGPGIASAHCGIAQIYHRTGMDEWAVREYDQAQRYNPSDPNIFAGRAASFIALRNLEAALLDYDRALRIDPNHTRSLAGRGDIFGQMGSPKRALNDFDTAIRLDPGFAYARRLRGALLSQLGEHERALLDFDEVIRQNPRDSGALKDRGGLYVRLNKFERAIEDLDQSIALDSRRASSYLNRAAAYSSLGQYERALRDLEQAVRIDPRNAAAYTNAGLAQANLGHFVEAIQALSEAVRLDPKSPLYHYNRATTYSFIGQYDDAKQDFDDAVKLDPTFAMAYLHRGLLLSKLGRQDDAIHDFNKAIELQPNAVRAYVGLASAHDALGHLENALSDYDMAIRLNPRDAAVHRDRGNARRASGDWDGAIADFASVIALEPRNSDAYISRGWLLYITGLPGAESDARTYLDLKGERDPFAPYMAILGALAARRAGHEAEARVFLDGALADHSTGPWPAPVLRYLRRIEPAKSLLESARTDTQKTEARVFLGVDLLQSGDRKAAFEHLRWVRDQGVKHSIATDLARETLRRMEATGDPGPPPPDVKPIPDAGSLPALDEPARGRK
jgi:tetratricopeptide (TPR) repeat protein